MEALLELSTRYLDSGVIDGPFNPMGLEVHELASGVALVEGFSHIVTFDSGDGLVCFDTSLGALTPRALTSLRTWSTAPVHSLVYTHGHADHVGGAAAFLAEASEHGRRRPEIVGHANIPARFDRYELTEGYVTVINTRQFGGTGAATQGGIHGAAATHGFVRPTTTYDDELEWRAGDVVFELRHGRGETDDHTWAWVPSHRAAVIGDFLIWMFPNAGNPQKVQRYPREWATVLRQIAAKQPELLLPAHGLPVAGADRIGRLLDETARALEHLVETVLAGMNEGHRLDDIVHAVRLPDDLQLPWLRPLYDEPGFVVRNIWRMYGGWYDGNPARLAPPPDRVIASETARLAGGVEVLVQRALVLSEPSSDPRPGGGDPSFDESSDDLRLACHLIELAAQASPDDAEVHDARAEVYRRRRQAEHSLMSKGIYGDAERTSRDHAAYLRS